MESAKEYFDKFICEQLTISEENKEKIQDFYCGDKGKNLEYFLKSDAWQADLHGESRVYVVKHPDTKQIVLYFSLRCGSLFTTYTLDDEYEELSDSEKDCIEKLIDARRESNDTFYQMKKMYSDTFSKEQLSLLLRIEEHKYKKLQDLKFAKDANTALRVDKCYAGIEIQHFCRRYDASQYAQNHCALGFGLFWRKIIPIVLEISRQIGCEYLYLFAADESEDETEPKLITYYKEALGFRELDDEGVLVLKPTYDRQCVCLLQNIDNLQRTCEYLWEAFS